WRLPFLLVNILQIKFVFQDNMRLYCPVYVLVPNKPILIFEFQNLRLILPEIQFAEGASFDFLEFQSFGNLHRKESFLHETNSILPHNLHENEWVPRPKFEFDFYGNTPIIL